MKEKDITKAIRILLTQYGVWHYKHFGGFAGRKGISDIVGIYQARPLYIEVKRPGNKPTPEQVRFLDEVNTNGGIGFVAYGTQDVIERLRLPVLL